MEREEEEEEEGGSVGILHAACCFEVKGRVCVSCVGEVGELAGVLERERESECACVCVCVRRKK